MTENFIYGLLAVITLILFFYFIYPRLKLLNYRSNLIRIILFFSMIGFLAYDFYIKGKYNLLIVLGLGSIAFIVMILRSKK